MTVPAPSVDLSSFEDLYRRHFAFAWRSLGRLGVPERDLNDATQDVFVIVYRKLSEFDAATRATTWIYAICLRVASDRRRSARARYEVLAEPSVPDPPSQSADDEQRLQQQRALLSRALDALSLEQRAVFTLFELDGLSGDEIADLLSIPIPTVHSRLRVARARVREVLERERARERFDLLKVGGRS